MEILASVIIIFATVMHTLIPDAPTLDVRGAKIAHVSTTADTDVDTTVEADTDADTATDSAEVSSTALEEARARRQAALDEARARREDAREGFQEKREEFRQRLDEIRDAVKRRIVEQIGTRLANINDRWTNHFDNVLSRLSEILAKIGTRADKQEEAGQDVASVREAIADAEAAIDDAQDAVNAQAEKSYIIEISDEEGLRDDVQAVRDQLHDDLTATRDVVKGARQAVHDAFQALKDVRGSVDRQGGVDGE